MGTDSFDMYFQTFRGNLHLFCVEMDLKLTFCAKHEIRKNKEECKIMHYAQIMEHFLSLQDIVTIKMRFLKHQMIFSSKETVCSPNKALNYLNKKTKIFQQQSTLRFIG